MLNYLSLKKGGKYMTLYEQFQNGLNLIVYCQKAYQNILKAIRLTILEDGYTDKKDMEVLWEAFIYTGNIEFLDKNEDIRNLIKTSFNMHNNYIDSRELAMIRDYESMSIDEFLNIYNKKTKKVVDRDKSRMVKSLIGPKEAFLDCVTISGTRRKDNQDFTCSITSPINENWKLLVVCDGVGSSHKGDKASEIVTKEFIKWFNAYDFNYLSQIENEINHTIENARNIIKKECSMAATTFTFAIITDKETIIGNVGDSRAYIIKDENIKQTTKDDSEVWEKFVENPRYQYEKDILRFMPGNNVITNAVDFFPLTALQIYHVQNNEYDGILLTSDGVTDIISDNTITRIINKNKNEEILDKLMYESCFRKPSYPPEDYDELLYPTLPGKDNASAAIYLKRR